MELQSNFVRDWNNGMFAGTMLQCDAGRFSVNRCTNEADHVVMIGNKYFNLCDEHNEFVTDVIGNVQALPEVDDV